MGIAPPGKAEGMVLEEGRPSIMFIGADSTHVPLRPEERSVVSKDRIAREEEGKKQNIHGKLEGRNTGEDEHDARNNQRKQEEELGSRRMTGNVSPEMLFIDPVKMDPSIPGVNSLIQLVISHEPDQEIHDRHENDQRRCFTDGGKV